METIIKHHPRRHHTKIVIEEVGKEGPRVFNGRLTEVIVHSSLSGSIVEVNMYASFEAEEPVCHELLFYVTSIRVVADEEPFPEPAPKPTTDDEDAKEDM